MTRPEHIESNVVARLLKGRIDRFWRSLALVIVLVIGGLFYFDWREFQTASARLDQVRLLQKQTNTVLSTITEAETGERGYLLTGDAQYLDPYHSALADLPKELDQLAQTAAAAKREVSAVALLQSLIHDKIAELKRTITLRDEYSQADALALVRTDEGRDTMNLIRNTCKGILVVEDDKVFKLNEQSQSRASSVLIVVLTGCFGLLVLLWRLGAAVDSVVKEREESARSIEESRQQLQTTLASIGDAVIVTDAAGRVRFMNPVAAKLTGWTAAGAEKKPLNDVFQIVRRKDAP